MRVRLFVRGALLCSIAATCSLLASAQQQPAPSATFQVEVNFVDIDAVVTDERGNFVSDLTKDDFELLGEGKPQDIAAFSLVDIPAPIAASRARAVPTAPSDVKSNAQPISGRLYVIVLDDLNVSPLRSKVVVDAARQLIERHFGPDDMAAITYTSGRTDGAQEFTSERASLLAAIDKFQGRKLRSTVIEKADQYFQQHVKELELNQPDPDDPDAPTGPPQSGTVRGPMVERLRHVRPEVAVHQEEDRRDRQWPAGRAPGCLQHQQDHNQAFKYQYPGGGEVAVQPTLYRICNAFQAKHNLSFL